MEGTKIIHFMPFSSENSYLKLNDSSLSEITLENATFNSCLFFIGTWKKITFKNCKFFACNFDSLDISSCIFENCTFNYCRLDSCKMSSCSFINTEWKKSNVIHAQWILCQLDLNTSSFVDGYDSEEEEPQNTATWTFSKKMTFSA